MSRPPHMAVAALSFALLGASFGYVLACAYLAHRFGWSLQEADFLLLGRDLPGLRHSAPTEFLTASGIVGACVLLGLALSGLAANEGLTEFGRTRWQTPAEMRRNGFLAEPGRGFLLGKLGGPRSRRPFLASQSFPHALLVAPTGRGKGVGFVIPNLLTFKGSVVVLDVKGENFLATSRHRRALGDRVIRFAPADWSGTPTHRYNPLQRIFELQNPDQQMMELKLTAGLFLQTEGDSATGLLQGGIEIFVAAGMVAFERGTPTLGEIYRIAVGGGDKQKAYAELALEVRHPAARLSFQNLASLNDRTLTSYVSLLLTSGLDTWANPAIDAATSTSDFSFRDVRRTPHAVYLEVAPDLVRPLAPLIRLFFSDLIASLQAKEPGPDEPWRVMILLDEFDRLGRMPIVVESIKTLRSYGGHLAVVTQTIPALDQIYGENTRLSLQGGAGVKLYLTPSEQKTVEELSRSVGTTTKRIVSRSRPQGPSSLRSRTIAERTEQAPLLTEDEARTMSLEDVVLVIDAQNPIRARRIKFYEDRRLAALHAAQTGPMPYPAPIDPRDAAETAALKRKLAALEARVAAAEARPVEPAPAAVCHEPEATVPEPPLSATQTRRSVIRGAVLRSAPVQVDASLLTAEAAERLGQGVHQLTALLGDDQADEQGRDPTSTADDPPSPVPVSAIRPKAAPPLRIAVSLDPDLVTPDQAMMLRRGVIELRRLLGEPPILQKQMPLET